MKGSKNTGTSDSGPFNQAPGLYQELFECAPIGIMQTSLDGKILNINPAMANILGYNSTQACIAAIKDLKTDLYVDPGHREEIIQQTLQQNRIHGVESRFRRKNGSIITCRVHIRAARDKNGELRYLEGFVENITHQKKIADALKASEARYRGVFENTGAGTIIIEKDTSISFANAGFEKLTGFSKEEIEGRMKWPQVIANPKDLGMMLRYHKKRRKSTEGVPIEYEFTLRDKFGNLKSIFLRVDMIPGSQQSVASLLDITSLKDARRNLRESESKLEGMLEAFEGLIYTCTASYRITYMNRALKDKVGPCDLQAPCYRAIYGLDAPCAWCCSEAVYAGRTVKYEFQNPLDGRWYYAVNSPIYVTKEIIVQKQTVLIDIHERKQSELALQKRDADLEKENIRLRAAIKDSYKFGDIVGKSPAMQKIYNLILKASATNANVIIYGESGTGKELVARAIHDLSNRRTHEFVPVNCGAIPQHLMESEFFGYKKGAFTGAARDKSGFFDHADQGTLFLDELGEISEEMQIKLLRVLEGRGFTPVGDVAVRKPDVRIISATNRNLRELVERGRIREDFFYRIHIIPIQVPSLRERKEDIPLMIDHFLKTHGNAKTPVTLGGQELQAIIDYDWPGNVRELENTLQRFVCLNMLDFPGFRPMREMTAPGIDAAALAETDLPLRTAMASFEKQYLLLLLDRHQWNRTKVAQQLGIERKTLYLKMKQLRIQDARQ
jgi:PAS domain S-box-containing protein